MRNDYDLKREEELAAMRNDYEAEIEDLWAEN